jgi:hypothetical protein
VATETSDTAAYREVNPALTYPPKIALTGWPDPHPQIHTVLIELYNLGQLQKENLDLSLT